MTMVHYGSFLIIQFSMAGVPFPYKETSPLFFSKAVQPSSHAQDPQGLNLPVLGSMIDYLITVQYNVEKQVYYVSSICRTSTQEMIDFGKYPTSRTNAEIGKQPGHIDRGRGFY
jgi:hypothetical protein